MKTLYLECAMGAAGDMLMAALYELCPEKEKFLQDMNRLLPGATVEAEPAVRQGISGTHMRVTVHGYEEGHHHHEHEHGHAHHGSRHEHHSLASVTDLIGGFPLPPSVLEAAKETYALIADAESCAHGVPVGEVHFHEVGALDAVIDVTGVCYLIHLLSPDAVSASPVTVGGGTVRTAHGILPVPAPATARLLKDVPIAVGDIAAELCTPTGAALLRTFAKDFGPMPSGKLLSTGYGCGSKDFPRANCLRAFLLDTAEASGGPNGCVAELKANLDDMTGEALGHAMERLLDAGALDVFYTPIQTKKNRPGILLTCLCRPSDADSLAKEILRHTSSFGVRRTDCPRWTLDVKWDEAETSFGPVPYKIGVGYGLKKGKPEYEALAALAKERGLPLSAITVSPPQQK